MPILEMSAEISSELTGNRLKKRKSLGISRRKRLKHEQNHSLVCDYYQLQHDKHSPSVTSPCCNIISATGSTNSSGATSSDTPVRIRSVHTQSKNQSNHCEKKSDFKHVAQIYSPAMPGSHMKPTNSVRLSTPKNSNRPRTGLNRSQRKRFKTPDFKTAVHADTTGLNKLQADEDVTLTSQQELSTKLQQEIDSLKKEGLKEAELQVHMTKMHEYNELKDMGQMLLGKIALIEGVTTKDLYSRYGLDLTD